MYTFFIPPLRAQADIERNIISHEWTVTSITRSLLLLVSDVAELKGLQSNLVPKILSVPRQTERKKS